jgi:hypothetical protein
VIEFLLPASYFFDFFLLETSSCFLGCSLQLEVFVRKLKLSTSIAVVLQASQTAVVFYRFSSSIISCRTSQPKIVMYHLSSSIVTVILGYSGYNFLLPIFQVQLLAVLQDFSGYNFFLYFLQFSFWRFICLSTSKEGLKD